jgi:hypothetical protein
MYPWPFAETDMTLEEALNIAMDYLELTRQAYPFSETQRICARVILQSWRQGTRHRIRLANDAIRVIEALQKPAEEKINLFYPKVS